MLEFKNVVKTKKIGNGPQWGVADLVKDGVFQRKVALLWAPDKAAWYPAVGVSDKGEPADEASIIRIDGGTGVNSLLFCVFVTKGIPREDFTTWVKAHPGQYIIHWTVTGMGGTRLEPGVKPWTVHFDEIDRYIQENGVNRDHCVLRCDPIYPSPEGVTLALQVLREGKRRGFSRFRFSWMDYTGFRENQIPQELITMLRKGARDLDIDLRSCAETEDHEPCLSPRDFSLLGFPEDWFLEPLPYDYALKQASDYPWRFQERSTCHCGANKIDFIINPAYTPCKHGCAYCYLRGFKKNEGPQFFKKWGPDVIEKELLRMTKSERPDRQIIQFYMGNSALAENNWLSNMYPVKIIVNGVEFGSAEAAFQAMKFVENTETYKKFSTVSAAQAKALGGKTFNLDSKEHGGVGTKRWNQHKIYVLAQILKIKFEQNEDLREKLLATGDAYLEEAAPKDYYWGAGANGKGTNMTGKILMMVRDAIRYKGDGSKSKDEWNLLDENVDWLINTNNCQGVQGCGVAKAFENDPRFKDANANYKKLCANGQFRPGVIAHWGRAIYCAVKDKMYVEGTKIPAKSERKWILDCLVGLAKLKGSMAIPRMGCGAGGRDWYDVFPYILRDIATRPDRVIINGVDLSRPSAGTTGTTGPVYYTSYYSANPPVKESIRISLKAGKGYEAIDSIEEFIPDEADVWGYKDHKISAQTYEKHYRAKLDKIPADKLSEILKRCQGKYMLCFEKSSDFCHRHILAAWLREHGYKCEEWQRR